MLQDGVMYFSREGINAQFTNLAGTEQMPGWSGRSTPLLAACNKLRFSRDNLVSKITCITSSHFLDGWTLKSGGNTIGLDKQKNSA